jgi:hypothetical protein
MPKKPQPRFALFCDEAGGPADEWRSLAVVSGSLSALLDLEHDLRQALDLSGVRELKWSQLRKRPEGLRAAALTLELATAAAANGTVRFQLWCWQARAQPKAWPRYTEPQRMQAVYAKLLPRTARQWVRGRWLLLPDERTGVDWSGLKRTLMAPWRKAGARVSGLYPVDSRRWALIQCCDLLAGLLRHSWQDHGASRVHGPGAAAKGNRDGLLLTLLQMSRQRRLGLQAKPSLQGKSRHFSAHRIQRWA